MKEVISVQALGPAWTLGTKFSPPQYIVTLSASSDWWFVIPHGVLSAAYWNLAAE